MKRIFSALWFVLIFTGVSIILSLFAGLVWRQSLVILVLSFVLSYLLFRKFRFDYNIPRVVYLVAILVFFLSVHPLLFIHPFFNSSADPAPTTAAMLIGETIPPDYSPYADLAFNYQLGFPLFAKLFIDLLPVEPYLVTWAIAGIFSGLQVIFLYVFASLLLHSRKAGMIAAFLFLGTKVVFMNMYFGEYTWIMGTTFFFAAFACLSKKSSLAMLFFPAMVAVHPGVTFNALLFLVLYVVFFWEVLSGAVKMVVSSVLALPSLLLTYSAAAANLLSGQGSGGLGTGMLATLFIALPRLDSRIVVLIAGEPKSLAYLESLKARSQSRGVETRIIFYGPYSTEEIPTLLNAADLAILPYKKVTQSGALNHALAYHLPVITSNLAFFRELNAQYHCLLMFKDKNDLVTSIKKSLGPRTRQKLKQNAKQFLRERSITTIANQFVSLYRPRR